MIDAKNDFHKNQTSRKKERKFIYLSIENSIIENKNKIIHTQKGQKMS